MGDLICVTKLFNLFSSCIKLVLKIKKEGKFNPFLYRR